MGIVMQFATRAGVRILGKGGLRDGAISESRECPNTPTIQQRLALPADDPHLMTKRDRLEMLRFRNTSGEHRDAGCLRLTAPVIPKFQPHLWATSRVSQQKSTTGLSGLTRQSVNSTRNFPLV